MELFDSHAHYNDEKFDEDREELINKIYESGVTRLINAGYSLESSKYALEIRNLLNSLSKDYGFNELDSMLVLKDILYHEWKDKK